MKKLLTVIAMAAVCLQGFTKTADEVINDIKTSTGAMVVNFDKETLKSQLLGNEEVKKNAPAEMVEIWNKIEEGTVLILDNATKENMDVFNGCTESLDTDGSYEPISTVFNNNEHVKILGREADGTIKELVVIVADSNEGVMVSMKCDINKEDVSKLINNKTINIGLDK